MQIAASLDVHLNHGGGWIPGPAEHCLDTESCRGEAPWNDALGSGLTASGRAGNSAGGFLAKAAGLLACCSHPRGFKQLLVHRHMLCVAQDKTSEFNPRSSFLPCFRPGLLKVYMRLNPGKAACHSHALVGPHCPSWNVSLPPTIRHQNIELL